MSKALEEIKTLRGFNQVELNNDKNVNKSLDIIEKELQRLEAIDNTNPSEELGLVKRTCEIYVDSLKQRDLIGYDIIEKQINEALDTIKQALLKSQEQEKFFDDNLVFENGHIMSGFDYKGKQIVAIPLDEYSRLMEQEKVLEILKPYLRLVGNCLQAKAPLVDSDDLWVFVKEITNEEEFDLLKRYL